MSQANYFIEPEQLEAIRSNENVIIIDLCKAKQYAQAHIPEAHFVNYADIVKTDKPVMGLLPDDENFSALLSSLGISKKSLIIAYDDEGGGCAARFVWTLHVFGHETAVVLNGGLHSWANEGHPLSKTIPEAVEPSNYSLNKTHHHTATRAFIQTHLDDDDIVFLDARSLAEYIKITIFAGCLLKKFSRHSISWESLKIKMWFVTASHIIVQPTHGWF